MNNMELSVGEGVMMKTWGIVFVQGGISKNVYFYFKSEMHFPVIWTP